MRHLFALRFFCVLLAAPFTAQAQQPTTRPATTPPPRTATPPKTTTPIVKPGAAAKPGTTSGTKTTTAPTGTASPKTSVPAKTSPAPAKTSVPANTSAITNKSTTSVTADPSPTGAAKAAAPAAKPQPPLPANLGSSDQSVRYQNGKTLINQARYDLAMQELEPLTAPAAKFAKAPESAYLYAVAATRAKKWADAEQMLNLLRTEYPSWPGMPDAFFLQAQVSFEQAEPDNALTVLNQIPAGQLDAERENMKATYLPRIKDKPLFQNLLRKYPQDAAVGRAYANKLVSDGWYTDADKSTLDQLITQFSLDRNRYTPRPRAVKKGSYNVAVLLPFEFNDPSWEKIRKNQFVSDLYAGMRIAQDSLQRENHPVQLFAYDTGADTLQLKQVLALPELAGMDMIIGPVYKSGSKILARYARERQILCVNPLSQDGELVLDNEWHYLFEPSNTTQARQAAQFAFSHFTGRTAVVIYEDTKNETAFGQAYKAAYEALGGKVQVLRMVDSDAEEALNTAFSGIDLKTVGHLVVASDNRKAGPYVMGLLQAQGARIPLITYASWLENPRISLGQLDARDVYFIDPHHLDKTAFGVRRFRQLYIQRQNLPPSVFANIGFELLYYFGSQLHQFGPAFQQNLAASGPVSGSVFQGIGYPNGAHDNQYVPITKLEHLEIEVLNPVGLR
ncbi:ABC transporter substrate-binding protein [Hymenobacter sp. BT491]|uniref:ABC transporter substrate-binding protein n=1 Tax=Hymenobacter sp. BT491 TaxID=2766779 RepID=UPI001653BFCD|nr:ABC transporter substrate-binding protein [Hymenobacter sp. BT491]MBC6989160.1 amino acid ABC transporter substrate-binding protein [Hymenobacter sp. BT491]